VTSNRTRLAEALRSQGSHLKVLLQHPDRDPDNFHLALAGVLRSMLCDRDWPTLLALARELSMDLRVWGPYPPQAASTRPPSFAFNALTMSALAEYGAHEINIEEFMDAPIGAVSVSRPGEVRPVPTWYTASQLIKWAANKEGPAHFDPKSSTIFESIGSSIVATGSVTMIGQSGETPITDNDNLLQRMALIQIAEATAVLVDQVLAKHATGAA
jgi:hypothetical protein